MTEAFPKTSATAATLILHASKSAVLLEAQEGLAAAAAAAGVIMMSTRSTILTTRGIIILMEDAAATMIMAIAKAPLLLLLQGAMIIREAISSEAVPMPEAAAVSMPSGAIPEAKIVVCHRQCKRILQIILLLWLLVQKHQVCVRILMHISFIIVAFIFYSLDHHNRNLLFAIASLESETPSYDKTESF